MTKKDLLLFDMDGTLTAPRQRITQEILRFLQVLRKRFLLAVVGGSDLTKLIQQLGEGLFDLFDYVFAENGLVAYKHGCKIGEGSIEHAIGKQTILEFKRYCENYICALQLPLVSRRPQLVEVRIAMLNVSPIGRNCTQEERDEFEKEDRVHGYRQTMIDHLRGRFTDLPFVYVLGGQISFDVFPQGWDKTYCLRYLDISSLRYIHFFGDKTEPGGNDYAIYTHYDTVAHAVSCPLDTMRIVRQLFDGQDSTYEDDINDLVHSALGHFGLDRASIQIILKFTNFFFSI